MGTTVTVANGNKPAAASLQGSTSAGKFTEEDIRRLSENFRKVLPRAIDRKRKSNFSYPESEKGHIRISLEKSFEELLRDG